MSNVILNGINSDDVPGLLIQKLPPIIKPAQRIEVEEIDGRAGDIITPLGYAAYDRDLLIGLRWNYDLDQIIAFFNGSGEAIFSNEPDKIYTYRIDEAVNYEALGRLKSANVVFHCQPFKHKAGKTAISISGETTVVNEGNVFSRPTISVTGSGTVGIYLNGRQMLALAMGDTEQTITIDLEEQNAYSGSVLMNRSVTGSYAAFTVPVGSNTMEVTGTVSDASISRYSRWI